MLSSVSYSLELTERIAQCRAVRGMRASDGQVHSLLRPSPALPKSTSSRICTARAPPGPIPGPFLAAMISRRTLRRTYAFQGITLGAYQCVARSTQQRAGLGRPWMRPGTRQSGTA